MIPEYPVGVRLRGRAVATDAVFDPDPVQDAVLGSLVRVVEEAAGDHRWALIGAAACRLQGVSGVLSPNLEFIAAEPALYTLGEMLDLKSEWGRGTNLAAQRLHFMRGRVPVFAFGNPVFHGRYDSLVPMEIPSLWDARARVEVPGGHVLVTPLEWELLLAVVLEFAPRLEALRSHMRANGFDNRLLTRLVREGHLAAATEEAVWQHLETDEPSS